MTACPSSRRRRLTNHLRNAGAQSACIVAGAGRSAETALEAARGFGGLKGADLARGASTAERYAKLGEVKQALGVVADRDVVVRARAACAILAMDD